MPAVSKAQRKAMAIAEHHPEQAKGAAKEMAKSMSKKQLHDFASTSEKGLPEHKKTAGELALNHIVEAVCWRMEKAASENMALNKEAGFLNWIADSQQQKAEAEVEKAKSMKRGFWKHVGKTITEPISAVGGVFTGKVPLHDMTPEARNKMRKFYKEHYGEEKAPKKAKSEKTAMEKEAFLGSDTIAGWWKGLDPQLQRSLITGAVTGTIGTGIGALSGDTPEERIRRAKKYGLVGAAGGFGAEYSGALPLIRGAAGAAQGLAGAVEGAGKGIGFLGNLWRPR